MATTYDAIIVGSGACGSWAAMELTKAGLSVLMLEAGAHIEPAKDFHHTFLYQLDYRGQGTLRAWVRVVAVRESLMLHRGRKEIALGDAVLASVPDAADDPELRYLRGEARDHLAEAVARALASLSSRERALLRYSLIDGLTLDEIGAIYGAHKSSISRWLSRAREQLWEAARDELADKLSAEHVSSLVRSLRSGLDLSLERLLQD